MEARVEKLNAYISVFDGKLDVISSLQSLQITLELTVVKEDLLHHVGPLNEPKSLLKDNAWFNTTIQSQEFKWVTLWDLRIGLSYSHSKIKFAMNFSEYILIFIRSMGIMDGIKLLASVNITSKADLFVANKLVPNLVGLTKFGS